MNRFAATSPNTRVVLVKYSDLLKINVVAVFIAGVGSKTMKDLKTGIAIKALLVASVTAV